VINRILRLAAVIMTMGALAVPAAAQQAWSDLSAEMQIRLAIQAAPAEMREGATVQGYDASGTFVTLREGANDLVCMAPSPTGQERTQKRWDEFTAGTLPIPYGSVNYILHGTGFDPNTGDVTDPYLRWTIYTPNATPESTGISAMPSNGGPWLMFPGTPGSHIMITPPRGGGL
jgi:hypothetical protein